MVVRCPLRKIFKAGECPFGSLDFVQNDERRVRIDFAVEVDLERIDKAVRFDVTGEFACERGIHLKIDKHGVPEVSGSEFLQQVGLAHLPGSVHEQGQSRASVFPLE